MASSAQVELWHAEKVATQVAMVEGPNGLRYAAWGETRVSDADLERLSAPSPPRSRRRCASAPTSLFLLPSPILAKTWLRPRYTVELGDRAVCHRNATFGSTEAVFISTRLVEDRFGLAFEFFINVAHNFVEAASVPE